MNERELLELAAKADGRPGVYQHWEDSSGRISCGIAPNGSPGSQWWNPIRDKGEALDLAVNLQISVFPPGGNNDFAVASIEDGVLGDDGDTWIQEFVKGGNKTEATCRAITRAAAEIGKGMSKAPDSKPSSIGD